MKLKLFTLIVSFLIFVQSGYGDDLIKFEDYKKLSQERRKSIAGIASPELQKTYNRWDQIISMGGKWWGWHQAQSFIHSKKLDGFIDMAYAQVNLLLRFHSEMVEINKKSGMIDKEAVKAADALVNFPETDKERYLDVCWYLVKLAPTPEALALNKKAVDLAGELTTRLANQNITEKDYKAIDAAVKEIRDQMRKLPQLTPDQIEEGLAALPEDEQHR